MNKSKGFVLISEDEMINFDESVAKQAEMLSEKTTRKFIAADVKKEEEPDGSTSSSGGSDSPSV